MHSAAGRLLGYVVVHRASAVTGTWGGMSVSARLSLSDVCTLARATTLQLALFAIRRGSHHCLVSVPEGATEREQSSQQRGFLEALQPLVAAGLCHIVFTSTDDSLDPPLARRGLAASAAATALVGLEHLGIEPTRATVALHGPTRAGHDAVAALVHHGLRLVAEGDEALKAGVDVALIGGALQAISLREARAARARVLVTLAPTAVTPAARRTLHERGIVLIPDTVAAGGLFVAIDRRSRGLDEREAIAQSFAEADARCRRLLLEPSPRPGEPLAAPQPAGVTSLRG